MEEEKNKTVAVEKEQQHRKCGCEKYGKHLPKIIGVVFLVVMLGGYGYYKLIWSKHNLTVTQAKTKIEDFINNNLMQGGAKANITSVTKENGMFKVMVEIGEGAQKQEITSYLSADGGKFFPNVMDIAETEKQIADQKGAETKSVAEIPKTDKPTVELFVMSYCPYGTQIEKGILPVLETLGAKIDYKLKFVDYAMHDKKELDENLKQYCIQKNETKKLNVYLKCFLKDSEQAKNCLNTAGVNMTILTSCITATDKQFKVTESFNDKASWNNGTYPPFNVDKEANTQYSVKGSPTLIINGVEASASGRDSANLLKTICSGFKTEPKECSTELSSVVPSAGFGEGSAAATKGASAEASCEN